MNFFSKTIWNVLSIFVLQDALIDDDNDPLDLQKLEKPFKKKTNSKSNKIQFMKSLTFQQEHLNKKIEVCKLIYYSQITYKVYHIQKNAKACCACLKRF